MLKFLRITLGTILCLPIFIVWYLTAFFCTIMMLPLAFLFISPLCLLSGNFEPFELLFQFTHFIWCAFIEVYIDCVKKLITHMAILSRNPHGFFSKNFSKI